MSAWIRKNKNEFRNRSLSKNLRVGIFGSGKAAAYHLQTLKEINGVQVVCIVNRKSNLEPLVDRYLIPKSYQSVQTAIEDCQMDAAIVAVSIGSTVEVSKELMSYGIPCLIEKPPGKSYQEAAELKVFGEQSTGSHAVAFNRRCYSSVRSALECVRQLGRPYSIHIDAPENVYSVLQAKGLDAVKDRLFTNTCHAIDLFILFGGSFVSVARFASNWKMENTSSDYMAFIQFEGGVTGSFVSHWRSPGEWLVSIYGPSYKIMINLNDNLIWLQTTKHPKPIEGVIEDNIFKAGVYYQNFIYLESIATNSLIVEPLASLKDGCETNRLIDGIVNAEAWNA